MSATRPGIGVYRRNGGDVKVDLKTTGVFLSSIEPISNRIFTRSTSQPTHTLPRRNDNVERNFKLCTTLRLLLGFNLGKRGHWSETIPRAEAFTLRILVVRLQLQPQARRGRYSNRDDHQGWSEAILPQFRRRFVTEHSLLFYL